MNATEIIKKLSKLKPDEELECIILKKDDKKVIVACEVTQETAREMQDFLGHFLPADNYPAGLMGRVAAKDKRANPDAEEIDVEAEEVEDDATE